MSAMHEAPLFLLQVGGAIPSTPRELIVNSTMMTKIVLGVLAALSLISWAVMFGLWREMRKARSTGEAFLEKFDRTKSLAEAGAMVKYAPPSAFSRLFTRAMQYLTDTRGVNQQARERELHDVTAPPSATLTGSQIETLHLILDTEASSERDRMGRYLPWLASIGSVSPLIGLLGTVLGVIDAFVGIARSGSGNLSAVAPGVAEALIATAASLAVAIPATFGYNIFGNQLNRFDSQMERFGTSLIGLLVREGHI
jgi:biopolymer transport protein TolQ